MGKQKSRYQLLLENLSDWTLQSAKQDMLTMLDLVNQGKAYLRAAEDLGLDEIYTLENYLLRDLKTFSQRLSEDTNNSLWWQNTKYEFGGQLPKCLIAARWSFLKCMKMSPIMALTEQAN
jgi:hypothetical protein